jgi:SAM-dependent methyltransferase
MLREAKAIMSGLATYVPGYNFMKQTDGTTDARYCYSVWMRHLRLACDSRQLRTPPRVIAELGPGDSIGIGLAALISGSEKFYAFDLVPYAIVGTNLQIFDELVRLLASRSPIPADGECLGVYPRLSTYEFPKDILDDDFLAAALDPQRLARIRRSVETMNSPASDIVYMAPWADSGVVREASVDMIYSQAVLEHVDDLVGAYRAMRRWLRPGGLMSHQIDFRCHGKATNWDGHWAYPDGLWRIVVGRRPYLLNRQPHSTHVRLLAENNFRLVNDLTERLPSTLGKSHARGRIRGFTADDLDIAGAFMQAV